MGQLCGKIQTEQYRVPQPENPSQINVPVQIDQNKQAQVGKLHIKSTQDGRVLFLRDPTRSLDKHPEMTKALEAKVGPLSDVGATESGRKLLQELQGVFNMGLQGYTSSSPPFIGLLCVQVVAVQCASKQYKKPQVCFKQQESGDTTPCITPDNQETRYETPSTDSSLTNNPPLLAIFDQLLNPNVSTPEPLAQINGKQFLYTPPQQHGKGMGQGPMRGVKCGTAVDEVQPHAAFVVVYSNDVLQVIVRDKPAVGLPEELVGTASFNIKDLTQGVHDLQLTLTQPASPWKSMTEKLKLTDSGISLGSTSSTSAQSLSTSKTFTSGCTPDGTKIGSYASGGLPEKGGNGSCAEAASENVCSNADSSEGKGSNNEQSKASNNNVRGIVCLKVSYEYLRETVDKGSYVGPDRFLVDERKMRTHKQGVGVAKVVERALEVNHRLCSHDNVWVANSASKHDSGQQGDGGHKKAGGVHRDSGGSSGHGQMLQHQQADDIEAILNNLDLLTSEQSGDKHNCNPVASAQSCGGQLTTTHSAPVNSARMGGETLLGGKNSKSVGAGIQDQQQAAEREVGQNEQISQPFKGGDVLSPQSSCAGAQDDLMEHICVMCETQKNDTKDMQFLKQSCRDTLVHMHDRIRTLEVKQQLLMSALLAVLQKEESKQPTFAAKITAVSEHLSRPFVSGLFEYGIGRPAASRQMYLFLTQTGQLKHPVLINKMGAGDGDGKQGGGIWSKVPGQQEQHGQGDQQQQSGKTTVRGFDVAQFLGRFSTNNKGELVNVALHADVYNYAGHYNLIAMLPQDNTFARGSTYILNRGTQCVVFDVDGTLTVGDGQIVTQAGLSSVSSSAASGYDLKVRQQAVSCVRMWAAKGYQPVYVSGRQGSFYNLTLDWLQRHHFPPGPIHLTKNHIPTLPVYSSVGLFKLKYLKALRAKGLTLYAAYGNTGTDVRAYQAAGIPPYRTYAIGSASGTPGTVAISDFTSHIAQHVLLQPLAHTPIPYVELLWSFQPQYIKKQRRNSYSLGQAGSATFTNRSATRVDSVPAISNEQLSTQYEETHQSTSTQGTRKDGSVEAEAPYPTMSQVHASVRAAEDREHVQQLRNERLQKRNTSPQLSHPAYSLTVPTNNAPQETAIHVENDTSQPPSLLRKTSYMLHKIRSLPNKSPMRSFLSATNRNIPPQKGQLVSSDGDDGRNFQPQTTAVAGEQLSSTDTLGVQKHPSSQSVGSMPISYGQAGEGGVVGGAGTKSREVSKLETVQSVGDQHDEPIQALVEGAGDKNGGTGDLKGGAGV